MPYSAEISRTNPTCLAILIDQSASMGDAFGGRADGASTKAAFLADVVNRTLQDLVLRCAKGEEIRDYFHILVLGYGQSVMSALPSSGRDATFVPISAVAHGPAHVETRSKKSPDGAGGLVDQEVRFPVWVEPTSNGGTPMCSALDQTHEALRAWLTAHPNCFPPVVLHITDGESTDGDPRSRATDIQSLRSSDGAVLLLNCHLSSDRSATIEYPHSPQHLPNTFAETLFEMSSVFPSEFLRAAESLGRPLVEGARGFVFNADAVSLVQFFNIGTRPANLR